MILSRGELHCNAPRTPRAGLPFEPPSDGKAAKTAFPTRNIPLAELVPVALDEQRPAIGTPSAPALSVVDVSGVNIGQPF